jgi:uncharacterized protein involved in exopolysaccharide biosynthesis
MNNETTITGPDYEPEADKTRLTSATLRADVIRIARQVAQTHDKLAETLRRIASQHPDEAARLRTKIGAARAQAAQIRNLASYLQDRSPDADNSQAYKISGTPPR